MAVTVLSLKNVSNRRRSNVLGKKEVEELTERGLFFSFLRFDAGYARHRLQRDVDMICVASTVETSKVRKDGFLPPANLLLTIVSN